MRRRPYIVVGLVVFLSGAVFWMTRVPSGPVTPSGRAPLASGWQAVTVVEGLEHPWAVAWLPDGTMLITERGGRLRLVQGGQLRPEAVQGVPESLGQNHGGLLDVVLHPNFAENRWVYFTYGAGTEEANSARVARGRLADDFSRLTDVQVVLVVHPLKPGTQHFGSRLLWLPDGTLLLGLGDGGNPPTRIDGELAREQAQRLDSQLGKVLRLHEDGSVPEDNPFLGQSGVDPYIWSYGHRNIQGLARDPVSGRIYATEHGSRGGDELNGMVPGKNYGWPRATYSIEYTFGVISWETSLPGMVDPLVVWTLALAPSGLMFYTGEVFGAWRGDLFAGALKQKEVRRIDLDASGQVLGQETLFIGERVRDVKQGPDGLIYVLTDEPAGRLLRLEPAPVEGR